jgi:small subunit ribosomal protein S18
MRPVATNCPFCKEKKEPDYKNTGELGCYITDRGKIIGKGRTGLCAKHQRRIARAIKRARQIGLLPFGGSLS